MAHGGTALDEAIAAAGGVARLATAIGVHHSQVVRWRRSGRIPASRLAGLEAVTGIPRQRLRPDLFAPGRVPDPPAADEARGLGLDPEAIAARAVGDAIRAEKARRWQEENRAAIEAHSRWVEEHGLPLAKYRMF
jgi:antitoxin CcdA